MADAAVLEITRKGKSFICECTAHCEGNADRIFLELNPTHPLTHPKVTKKNCYDDRTIASSLLQPGKVIKCWNGSVFAYAGELCDASDKKSKKDKHYFVEIIEGSRSYADLDI